jgi:energy-coupling factor transporter ATP-binding protein EcfA2
MPDLRGRPLLDTASDQALYVGRDSEEERLEAALGRALNALVVGARGAGKTTLLRHLAYHLRIAGRPVAFVDGSTAEDLPGFLDLVAYRLSQTGIRVRTTDRPPRPAAPSLVDAIEGLAPAEPPAHGVVLLVDELPGAADAHTLFGRLRDTLWQLPYEWVVAAPEDERSAYLTPPADAFFEVVVALGKLGREQQEELLRTRLGDDAALQPRLLPGGSLYPREVLESVRGALLSGRSAGEMQDLREERAARASALGRAPAMLLEELDSSGPASASDEGLLRRLGWTRERAVQVLRQLEEAGLVTSFPQKGATGRPRKIYAAVELSCPTSPGESRE